MITALISIDLIHAHLFIYSFLFICLLIVYSLQFLNKTHLIKALGVYLSDYIFFYGFFRLRV